MKFRVFWTGEDDVVRAKELFDYVSILWYRDKTTRVDPSDWQSLHSIECVTDDFGHGWRLVHCVENGLRDRGVHRAQVSIDGILLRKFVSILWRRNCGLQEAVREAVKELKRTRSSSPSSRVGNIRRNLEGALALYSHNKD